MATPMRIPAYQKDLKQIPVVTRCSHWKKSFIPDVLLLPHLFPLLPNRIQLPDGSGKKIVRKMRGSAGGKADSCS
jgi:hypothetical protein